MKHAGAETLAALDALLQQLRGIAGLVERKPGIFYFRSKAFLHFHEDPAGLFADVKLDLSSYERIEVSSRRQQAGMLDQVRRAAQRKR